MIRRGSLLVKLVKLVDHIPAPPPQEKLNRGRPFVLFGSGLPQSGHHHDREAPPQGG